MGKLRWTTESKPRARVKGYGLKGHNLGVDLTQLTVLGKPEKNPTTCQGKASDPYYVIPQGAKAPGLRGTYMPCVLLF